MVEEGTTPAEPAKTRNRIAGKRYHTTGEEPSAHASPGAEFLRFSFANDESHDVKLSDFPQNVLDACAWHGLSQKLGDSYASAKTPEDAVESFETLYERLTGGEWVKAREGGGPRPSMVVDAIVAALVDAGEEVDDTRRAGIVEKVKTKEGRAAALANPAIKAQYEAVRAEAAKAKAKAAKDAAKTSESDLSEF